MPSLHGIQIVHSHIITTLLNGKFQYDDGSTNAKSAYHWLMDKGCLPCPNSSINRCPVDEQWTAEIAVLCGEAAQHIVGKGRASTKKSAEQEAYLQALQGIELYVRTGSITQEGSSSGGFEHMPQTPDSIESYPSLSTSRSEDISSVSDGSSITCLSDIDDCVCSDSDVSNDISMSNRNVIPNTLTRKQTAQVDIANREYTKFQSLMGKTAGHAQLMIMSMDVEKHDAPGSSNILEFGVDIAILDPVVQSTILARHKLHYIVSDHLNVVNRFVPSNRGGFVHGQSIYCTEAALMDTVQKYSQLLSRNKDCILVGHTLHADIAWLEGRCKEMNQSGDISAVVDFKHATTLDIAQLDRAVRSDYSSRRLEVVGHDYDVQFAGCLHNAGNDAVFTMDTFLAMVDKLCT